MGLVLGVGLRLGFVVGSMVRGLPGASAARRFVRSGERVAERLGWELLLVCRFVKRQGE